MELRYSGEITDPIHKNIKFTTIEKEIIDTFIFQRLRRIRQLAGAHLVYPGALHSRFEHSLGSMFLAGLAGQTLYEKEYFNDVDTIEKLRLAALLHDIGHGPFSHLFEEVLADCENYTHEDLGQKIILKSMISDILSKYGFDPIEISNLSFGKHKVNYLNEIISGGLSVDLMDYLPRDSYFSGTEYGKIDYHRIINSLEVTSKNILGINKSALYSFESMLISRYQMFKAVYFHKTVRSGEVMILNALKIQNKISHITNFKTLDDFYNLHDELLLEMLINPNRNIIKNNRISTTLALDYKNRHLLKCIYEYFLLSDNNKNNKKSNNLDKPLSKINNFKNKIREIKKVIDEFQLHGEPIFLDISRAPSIPLAPKKEEVRSVMIIDKKTELEKPFDQIPLINAISGYLDMLRVYTTKERRDFFEKQINQIANKD